MRSPPGSRRGAQRRRAARPGADRRPQVAALRGALRAAARALWEPFVAEPGAACRARRRGSPKRRLRAGTGRYDFGGSSSAPEPRSFPTPIPGTGCRRGTCACSPAGQAGLGAGGDPADLPETTRCAAFGMSETIEQTRADRDGEGLDIRRLSYSDLPAVLGDRAALVSDAVVAGDVRARALEALGNLPRRQRPDGLVGYLVCSRYADVWHLMNVAVVPERRRAGVATTMLRPALRGGRSRRPLHARGQDVERRGDRDVRRFGFKPAGRRRRYYHDNGEDALIMWLESPPACLSRPPARGC